MGRLAPGVPSGAQITLACIRDAAGRVVTMDELKAHLFGASANLDKKKPQLRLYISQARALCGDTKAERGQIITVVKRGWRWEGLS